MDLKDPWRCVQIQAMHSGVQEGVVSNAEAEALILDHVVYL